MITSAMNSGLNAMNAFSTGVHGSAYNLANMNTAGFNPVAVHYSSGPLSSNGLEAGVRPVVSRSVSPAAEPPQGCRRTGRAPAREL